MIDNTVRKFQKPLKRKNFSGFNITYQKKQALYH